MNLSIVQGDITQFHADAIVNVTVVDGRNLPGRTAPETAGALIGETVAEMIEEGLE